MKNEIGRTCNLLEYLPLFNSSPRECCSFATSLGKPVRDLGLKEALYWGQMYLKEATASGCC